MILFNKTKFEKMLLHFAFNAQPQFRKSKILIVYLSYKNLKFYVEFRRKNRTAER